MKLNLRTLTQLLTVFVAIAALFCAIAGLLSYVKDLTARRPYTEFPPEYDDYADWDME